MFYALIKHACKWGHVARRLCRSASGRTSRSVLPCVKHKEEFLIVILTKEIWELFRVRPIAQCAQAHSFWNEHRNLLENYKDWYNLNKIWKIFNFNIIIWNILSQISIILEKIMIFSFVYIAICNLYSSLWLADSLVWKTFIGFYA